MTDTSGVDGEGVGSPADGDPSAPAAGPSEPAPAAGPSGFAPPTADFPRAAYPPPASDAAGYPPPAYPQPTPGAGSYPTVGYPQPAASPPPVLDGQALGADGQPPVGGPQRKKHTGLIAGIVAGGVLLILIIAGVVGYIVIGASHTPQKAVEAYLGALVHGDATRALKLGGVTTTDADLLLNDRAYRASTDRITRYRLYGAAISGDGAAVTAQITQGGHVYRQSFALTKAGKDLLFFDKWQLKPVPLGRATVIVAAPADAAFTVAGLPLKDPSGTLSLRALPGSYPVKQTGSNEFYTAQAASASVVGFGDAASQPARVSAKLTPAGVAAATAAVNAYLDGCAASTEFRPTGCSFGATGEDSAYTYSNQKWTIDPRPVFTVGSWVAGGWAVSTSTPGSASFSATIANGSGSGTATAGPIAVRVTGFISKVDASGATFDPLSIDVPSA